MTQYEKQFDQWMKDCEVFHRVIIDPGFERLMSIQAILFICWLKTLKDIETQKKWADSYGKWAHRKLHKYDLHFKESYAYELMQQWNQMKSEGKNTTKEFLDEDTDLLANPVLDVAFNSILEKFMDQEDIHWLTISQADLKDWNFHPGMIIGWADGKKEEQGVVLDIREYDGMIFFLIRKQGEEEPVVRMAAVDGEFENGLIAPQQSWLDGFLASIEKQGIH